MSGIRIRLLSGPYAGNLYEPDADAVELFQPFMQNRWQWMLYCIPGSDAEEIKPWLEADVMVRIMQALFDGRGIRFSGTGIPATSKTARQRDEKG